MSSVYAIIKGEDQRGRQMTPGNNEHQERAYELGRMAEALSQNTRMLSKLTEVVEENSRSTTQLANRQSRMEAAIDEIKADQRKMINMSMTGHTNEAEVRKRLEFLDRMYQKDQDSSGVKKNARNAVVVAVAVAMFWWGWAVVKDAAIEAAAAQIKAKAQVTEKVSR